MTIDELLQTDIISHFNRRLLICIVLFTGNNVYTCDVSVISELKIDNSIGNAVCNIIIQIFKIVKQQFAFCNTRVSLIFWFQNYFEYIIKYFAKHHYIIQVVNRTGVLFIRAWDFADIYLYCWYFTLFNVSLLLFYSFYSFTW